MLLVSNTEQIEKGLAAVVEKFGKIDVFVANAGKNDQFNVWLSF
jgi:NAD(P)-dependent dehydrogenase (short-subunit alcohol dehydrogenase family)